MKHVVFSKGQKVKISNGQNASDFNGGQKWNIMSAYSIKDWFNKEFEIEGTIKLITFRHSPSVYGAYLLKYEGENVGYIYNTGIKAVEAE